MTVLERYRTNIFMLVIFGCWLVEINMSIYITLDLLHQNICYYPQKCHSIHLCRSFCVIWLYSYPLWHIIVLCCLCHDNILSCTIAFAMICVSFVHFNILTVIRVLFLCVMCLYQYYFSMFTFVERGNLIQLYQIYIIMLLYNQDSYISCNVL